MLSVDGIENNSTYEIYSKSLINPDLLQKISYLSKNSILASIGNTPLIQINIKDINVPNGVKIFAKIESQNPGGSIKDRAAWSIIREGIFSGKIFNKKGFFRPIVDASSGNTAIGYSLVASTLGIKLRLFIPKNASKERLKILKAYGAEVFTTDPLEGIDGAIEEVKNFIEMNPDYYYLDQYNNDANLKAHYYSTGREILEQTNNEITHFVSCLGTSGTFMGTGKRLRKNLGNKVQLIAVQPDSPFHGIEGAKHMGSSIIPGIYDNSFPDKFEFVSTSEAEKFTKILAKNGIFVGTSSGAALFSSVKVARNMKFGNVVTIFPDGGERYLSTNLWE
ncbi:MAG: Cysteine synthase B [Candidatus Heimdallarchaeota archaeon LC_3]|nr:MAG: Cysteine synthase B [Candidatus Heimdallarchaeota archaeon LC_3]